MGLAFLILFVLLVSNTCYAQYDQNQQQQNQYNTNRRVQPNQFIRNSLSRSGYGRGLVVPGQTRPNSRVRPKPSYGRVHPDDYVNIIDQQKHTVVVYPKKVYPQQRPYYQQQHQYQKRPYYQQQHQYQKRPYQQQHQYQKQPYYRQPNYQQQPSNPYIYMTKKTTRYNPNNRYMPRWPKLRGHCNVVPDIKINGVDPIKKECRKGHVVVLFLMKRRCDFCYHQLRELNRLGVHYKKAGKPLSVVVINHKRGPLSPSLIQRYPGLIFYEEPIGKDIFGRLGGAWRQIIVYDVCCRKQYLYGYPFSWMGYSFVRHAIFNTLYYDQVLCGVCKIKTGNTTIPPPPRATATTTPATTQFVLPTEI